VKLGREIGVAIAASAIFFGIERYLLNWPYPWDLVSLAVVFAVSIAVAFLYPKKDGDGAKPSVRIMSGNEVTGDMTGRIDGLETKGPSSETLSDNTVGGNANFEIKNSKF